jgi:hypothetical protein
MKEHLQDLLSGIERDRRDHVRDHIERHGWFPIAELVHNYDPRWAELVRAERQSSAQVGQRLGDVSDRCVLIEEGGRRMRMTSLDDALTLVDEQPRAVRDLLRVGGEVVGHDQEGVG